MVFMHCVWISAVTEEEMTSVTLADVYMIIVPLVAAYEIHKILAYKKKRTEEV